MPNKQKRRTSRSIGSRAPTLWRQHLISGSVTTGQAQADLSPPAQTTTARPVKLLHSIIEIQQSSIFSDVTAYYGTTVVTADALTALALPDADADPAHPWHWWEALISPLTIESLTKSLLIKTARIIRPNFRYIIVINGDSGNGGAVNFDIKLRLLWQL